MNSVLQNQCHTNQTKKPKRLLCLLLVAIIPIVLTGCSEDDAKTLTVTPTEVVFGPEGGSTNIKLDTDAGTWTIDNPASDWLAVSPTNGNGGDATITLSVNSRTLLARSAILTISANGANPVKVQVTQSSSDHLYTITADLAGLQFNVAGETKTITVTTDGAQWDLTSDAAWLQFNKVTGAKGSTTVDITVLENTTDGPRNANITIVGENATTLQIPVEQEGPIYPSYNTSPISPDASGMSSNAVQLAAKIKLGWNLGNTLEAIGGETAWGNPKASKALIDLVKASGFNAVRIPCSWNQNMANSATAQIKTEWLDRVKEVIQYCVDNDMQVLLNIHWDGGWLDSNINVDKQEETRAKQKAFWEQIATHLRDFDEHLMFASANEPPVHNETEMNILLSYHQTFIHAVRSTGGRNSYRVLVVQGPSTDIDNTTTLMNTLPSDPTANRMMVEVHYYGPWQFCGLTEDATWGTMFYYWGNGYHSTTDPSRVTTWGEESYVIDEFQKMKTKFIDNGIPVVLGEYGAIRRTTLSGDALTLHLASRAYYIKYVTQQAIAHNMLPFYWDEGSLINHGFGIMNRQNNTVGDQQALDALLEGANQ